MAGPDSDKFIDSVKLRSLSVRIPIRSDSIRSDSRAPEAEADRTWISTPICD